MVTLWSMLALQGRPLRRIVLAGPLNTRVRETGGGGFQHTDPDHTPRHDLRKRKTQPDDDLDAADPDLSTTDSDLSKADPDLN